MVFSFILASGLSQAVELKGHQFPDTVKVGDKELSLNGAGLRIVVRYGMSFNVYVAGLYLEKHSSDSNAILKNDEIKKFKSYYLRSVSVKDQTQPWRDAIAKNCFSDCSESKKKVLEFIRLLKRTKDGGQFDITFFPDRVEFQMQGENEPSRGIIKSAHFSKDLLAALIGEKPPTPELKKGLMGDGMPWTRAIKK